MKLLVWVRMTNPVSYQQWGNANASRQIILIHGWGMNSGVWNDVAKQLEDSFAELNIIAVDLPGYGQSHISNCQAISSSDNSPAYNSASLAQCLKVLLKDRQNSIIAWSMGGLVALEMFRQFPQLITQLILVSSSPRFVQGSHWEYAVRPQIFENFYQSLEQDHQATLKRFLAIQAMGSPSARNDIKTLQTQLSKRGEPEPNALKYGLKMLLTEDKRQQLLKINTIPITLIAGERDTLTNIKAQQQLAQQDNITLYPVAHAGHAPFISHPDEFIQLIRQAIARPH